jgi:hypothetical protein
VVFAQAISFVHPISRADDQSIQQPLPFIDQPTDKVVPARARSVKRDGNETAALLIFHSRYAPTPRVIDLKFLLTEPIWKYLGFSHEDAVRQFMRKLERRGLLSRYATVDRLEQVTTKYPLAPLLQRKVRV